MVKITAGGRAALSDQSVLRSSALFRRL